MDYNSVEINMEERYIANDYDEVDLITAQDAQRESPESYNGNIDFDY